MKPNLVLIQPYIGEMDLSTQNPTPPLGLLCAASVICGEMEVRLVDQRTAGNWRPRLAAAIDAQTVAIGVTSMTGRMLLNALEATREARRLSAAPIIWGGIHSSLQPEQTLTHELVDYVVEGEGEAALAELVRRLAAGADTAGIPGVWRKVDGKAQGTPRAPLFNMDDLPPVPYHLVDMKQYIQVYKGQRAIFYQTSRGCPCRCTYCYNQSFNKGRWRAKSADRVIQEIADLKERYDLSAIYLWDDNFFIDPARARQIISGVKKIGLRCMLHGADVETLSRMSDEDLDFLEEAGVNTLAIGVESAVDRVRADVLKKKGDIALVRAQLHRFKGRAIEIGCFFVLGFPTETAEEIKKTVAFAMEILHMGPNFRVPQFFNFTPYPGTELFSMLQKQGTGFPEKLDEWGTWEWNISSMHASQPEIKDLLRRVTLMGKYIDSDKSPFLAQALIPRLILWLYRPIARARLSNGFLQLMPELWLSDMIRKIRIFHRGV